MRGHVTGGGGLEQNWGAPRPQPKNATADSLFSFNESFTQETTFVNCIRQDAPRQLVRTFFAFIAVNVWNSLPDTVCFKSLAGADLSIYVYQRCY